MSDKTALYIHSNWFENSYEIFTLKHPNGGYNKKGGYYWIKTVDGLYRFYIESGAVTLYDGLTLTYIPCSEWYISS